MALKYQGHVFDALPTCTCCTKDAAVTMDDPTGTRPIRRDMFRTTSIKWRQVKSVVREMIQTVDFLQLKAGGLLNVQAAAIIGGADKVTQFQRWFDTVLERVILEQNGSYLTQYVARGYEAGQTFAQGVVDVGFVNINAKQREATIAALAVVELQGIMEAVSQQAVRAVANGLLTNSSPIQIVRAVWAAIDKIGLVRTRTLVELIIVKAFGDATLDVYAAVGVQEVGLIPEYRAIQGITDAVKKRIIKKKRLPAKPSNPRGGAGSRTSRKSTPSGSTIGRIEQQEANLERLGKVRVRTAGDDDVCPVCERIAKGGPYKIDKARALIPAHPRCRCVFIPANDLRFSENKRAAERKRKRKGDAAVVKDAEALATFSSTAGTNHVEGVIKRKPTMPKHAQVPKRKVKKPPKKKPDK